MRIQSLIWISSVVDKLAAKHDVEPHEVEAALQASPRIFFWEKGHRRGEDLYLALGRSESGRYLTVLFILKEDGEALILSARDMAPKERRRYEKKRRQ